MARHLLLTALIAGSLYTAMLFLIGHPFVANAATHEWDETQKPTANLSTNSKSTSPKNQVNDEKKPVLNAKTIVGIASYIDLNNAEEDINQLWDKLLSNQVLQNNVDWRKGTISLFTYYHQFSQDLSQASVAIGYDTDDLLLNSDLPHIDLPSGTFTRYLVPHGNNTVSDKAWAIAFKQGNLIERRILNRDGEQVSLDVIIVDQ